MEIEQISKAKVGPAYTTMRTFDTLEKAAENPGGGAGALLAGGLGLGVGVGAGAPLGKQLGESLNVSPQGEQDIVGRLQTLKRMLDEKLISQEEFEVKKKAILDLILEPAIRFAPERRPMSLQIRTSCRRLLYAPVVVVR